jgi:hypothetical protein
MDHTLNPQVILVVRSAVAGGVVHIGPCSKRFADMLFAPVLGDRLVNIIPVS